MMMCSRVMGGTRLVGIVPIGIGLLLAFCLCALPGPAGANEPSTGPADLVDWMVLQRVLYRWGNLMDAVQSVLDSDWVPGNITVPTLTNKQQDSLQLQLLMKDNDFANSLVTWVLPKALLKNMSRFAICWFRMWFLNVVFYLGVGAIWCYYCYFCFGKQLFDEGMMPPIKDMLKQMGVAISAMHWYALKDAITTHLVENGYSKTYARIDEVGLPTYFGYFILYMIFAEFWVYWAHRLVHDVPWLYKHVHKIHHSFNKADSLSPFAGIAHHPVDGILQVAPYSIGLFIFPIHYFTHLLCLVNALLWTHNLHDCIDAGIAPILGAGFHTVHHTTYVSNYGQFFIYFDWLFGTLTSPEDLIEAEEKTKKSPFEVVKSTTVPKWKSGSDLRRQKQKGRTPAKRQASIKRRSSKRKKSRR